MPQLLLELFSEEIPARMQTQAARVGLEAIPGGRRAPPTAPRAAPPPPPLRGKGGLRRRPSRLAYPPTQSGGGGPCEAWWKGHSGQRRRHLLALGQEAWKMGEGGGGFQHLTDAQHHRLVKGAADDLQAERETVGQAGGH